MNRNKGALKPEIVFIIAMFLLLLVPPAIFGQWWLFAVFMIFGVCFGIVELVCKAVTDKTISQHFWEWSVNNKKQAWFVLGCMLLSWLMLLYHFAIKMI